VPGPAPKPPELRARKNKPQPPPVLSAQPVPPLPAGHRYLKVTKQTWAAWHTSGAASRWSDADADAARRLIRLVDDRNRAEDAKERRLLETAVRQGEARLLLNRLGTVEPDARPDEALPYEPDFPAPPARAEFTTEVHRLTGDAELPPADRWWARVEALTLNERIALEHALRESDRWRIFTPSIHDGNPGRWNLLPGAAQALDRVCDSLWALTE
jgi:hypothetical protein